LKSPRTLRWQVGQVLDPTKRAARTSCDRARASFVSVLARVKTSPTTLKMLTAATTAPSSCPQRSRSWRLEITHQSCRSWKNTEPIGHRTFVE